MKKSVYYFLGLLIALLLSVAQTWSDQEETETTSWDSTTAINLDIEPSFK